MEKQTAFISRQTLLVIKTFACLFGLTLIGLMFAPQPASMQNSNRAVLNKVNKMSVNTNPLRVVNALIAPTPEPLKSTVRGRVFYEDTGTIVKRASIMLMGKEMRGRELSALTDNEGNFEMKDVPAGTYYAFVNAPGVVSPLAFADISKPRNEGFGDATENFQPIITDGLSDVFVQIPAKRGGAISGRVTYSDGDPAIGVKVEVLRKVKDKFLAVIPNLSSMFSMMGGGGFQTDDRGVYRFSGLPAGEYIVKVTESASHGSSKIDSYNPFGELFGSGTSLLTTYFPDAPDTKKAQLINVALGLEQPEINITLADRNLFRVEGKVVAAKDKSPIKNAKVYLKRDGNDTFSIFDEIGKRQQLSTTDEQGNWTFKELPKGDFKIVVEPPNASYEDYGNMDANDMNANVYMSNRMLITPPKPRLAKKMQIVTVEDKSLSNIIVELGYGATVAGTVVVENNAEMPNGAVVVSIGKEADEAGSSTTIYNYNEGSSRPSKVNRDFKLEGVAEGKADFRVYVNDSSFYAKSILFNGTDLFANPINLKEGDNLRNVQIVLSKETGTIKGKILNGDNQPAARAEISLVPADAAKRRNPALFRNVKTDGGGEFEIKLAPTEYAIIFFGDNKCERDGAECEQWLADAVKNAPKVTVKPNETEKLSLSLPK